MVVRTNFVRRQDSPPCAWMSSSRKVPRFS